MMHSTAELLLGLLHEWLGCTGELPLTIYLFLNTDSDCWPNELSNAVWTDVLDTVTGLVIDILELHSDQW